ncbi:MAG: hypothetical protein MAG451_00248 [Anaerolineales bacterium]|nr:hypothetical protein [Anaerolineales bacterium]
MNQLFDEKFLRQLERLAILSKRAMAGEIQGERRSPKRGQSVEFADYRNYTRGDDFRQIDWNVYARLERFFVKLFVEEEDLTVHLLIDTSRSMDWGAPNKLWYAQRATAALGYIALAGFDRVTVSAFNAGLAETMRPRRGKQQTFALFDFLAGLAVDGTTDMRTSLQRYAQQTPRAGPLMLITDLLDPSWQDGLRALQSRPFEITILHVLSPDEIDPMLEGDLRLIDTETGRPIEVTADFDLLSSYRENVQRWFEEIREFCSRRGIAYAQVDTTAPFERLIFALLQQRGVLG